MRVASSLALVVALCAGCGPSAPLADLPARPGTNVIVVSFDALRADALGTYGYDRNTSPHIDDFASRSIVFENAYALGAVTTLGFAALFTSRLPAHSFMNWRVTADRTLAESFERAGYATAGFMHNAHLSAVRGFDRGFQHYQVFTDEEDDDPSVVAAALAWIDDQADEPFFVWIHLLDPHSPWERREESSHLYDPDYEGLYPETGGMTFTEANPVELGRLRSLYDGEVFAIDALFGRFEEDLRARGLLERSVLALTSDHGEEFMQHGLLQHGQLYEENLRIPWILHHPDLQGGRRVETRVSQLDVLPTLTSLAGIAGESVVDGRDLRRVAGDAESLAAIALSSRRWKQASLHSGNHKLILECGVRVRSGIREPFQLFDLAADPAESHNLQASDPEATQALVFELFDRLDIRGCSDIRHHDPDEPDRELEGLGEEARQQLEALGYLDP